MGKNLVIVESPSKAKTIQKMLGKDYTVSASMGHIRDLPAQQLGVDVDKDFQPTYAVMDDKKKIVKALVSAAKGVDAVYLAPDPDREGEAIAWHLMALLKDTVPEDRFFRVTYNEITATAIRQAFEHAGQIDMRRVDSQQARRVLDRLVGYKVSPLLWKRVPGGSSAGRVQSVALRLVCEREREINAFVKERYWLVGIKLRKQQDPRDVFEARLFRVDGEKADIRSAEVAERILSDLQGSSCRVAEIKHRDVVKRARPPYITSSLQQAASGVLGYSPSRTMSLAQRLYEGEQMGVGLITYMRTDSFSIAREAQDTCRVFIQREFGDDYVPAKPNVFKNKKSAQEAHEAIRPTNVELRPDDPGLAAKLKPDELRLYRLIWQRFVASQMAPATIKQHTVDVEALPAEGPHTYLFRASASEVVFPGYMRITGIEKEKTTENGNGDAEDAELDKLPPLAVEEPLDCLEPVTTEKETQPPPRYSEASLVRALEENGVGRPSTYASIISTIQQRKYIIRDKRTLRPSDAGMRVNDFLIEHLPELFDVGFTANMENALDEIEEGKVQWTGMMKDFYTSFEQWIGKAKGPKADPSNIEALLKLLEGVTQWGPEQKRGKRTYSDEKFVASVNRQFASGKTAISVRQRDSLLAIVHSYRDQLPGAESLLAERNLQERYQEMSKPAEPPRESTVQKLQELERVSFEPPRTVGKRTYDDSVFVQSLREQVQSGKRLSERQVEYLDRLLKKYADQLGGTQELTARYEFASDEAEGAPDNESEPLLALLDTVQTWNPPVKQGKRDWDDQAFYKSLKQQFERKKALSPRQRAALKKMAQRYAEQCAGYDETAARLGLASRADLAKRAKRPPKQKEKEAPASG